MKKRAFIYLFFTFLFLSACKDDFLDTTNPNAPDLESTLQNPNDWEAVIQKQFNVIWHATQGVNGSIVIAGMADVLTSSWGNFGMLLLTSEPRVAIRNEEGWGVVEFSYYENFKVIGSVNDILRLLRDNPDTEVKDANGNDIRQKLQSVSLFLRGMAYGNLALKYDKAQYVDEQEDVKEAALLPFDDYTILINKTINDLEAALSSIPNTPDFTMDYYNGVSLPASDFKKLIRTLQAKYIMHLSRDAAENETNDWSTILDYAQQGLDFDFIVLGDGIDWYDDFKEFTLGPFPFARVDYRVIAAMAQNTPSRFPEDDSHPISEPASIDQRLLTDMVYKEEINYRPNRGLYHFSHYLHIRYKHLEASGAGAMPWILKAENDLIIAEALIRTGGDKAQTADLINITRVGRGGLPAMTGEEPIQELLDAIMHERMVELLATNGGQPYYDRRRMPDDDGNFHPYSGLQPGTPLQFPVPARELNVLGMDLYTFGG